MELSWRCFNQDNVVPKIDEYMRFMKHSLSGRASGRANLRNTYLGIETASTYILFKSDIHEAINIVENFPFRNGCFIMKWRALVDVFQPG